MLLNPSKSKREKAQVSAPIELFVAVVIMAFTLALGLKLIGDIQSNQCVATLQTQVQALKNAMVDVALGSGGTTRTVYFNFPNCGNQKIEGLQFVLYTDPAYCRACQSNYGYCWQVVPLAQDPNSPSGHYTQVVNAISCVNMAGDIQIKSDSCPSSAVSLSNTPCFGAAAAADCSTPTNYGVPSGIWDPSKTAVPTTDASGNSISADVNPSRWSTLDASNDHALYISLTKIYSLSGQERGTLQVCATPAQPTPT